MALLILSRIIFSPRIQLLGVRLSVLLYAHVTMKRSKSYRESHRSNKFRKNSIPKRPKPPNRWALESEIETTTKAAKKLKSENSMFVLENDSLNVRILNFNSVFNETSQVVKCNKRAEATLNSKQNVLEALVLKF